MMRRTNAEKALQLLPQKIRFIKPGIFPRLLVMLHCLDNYMFKQIWRQKMFNSNSDLKCEILSPAGGYDAMVAAFNAGADAVYVGGDKFGARANANNFSKEELLKSIDYAHLHNRKIYLTINTLLKENEISNELMDYLMPYYNAGLDAVIVQDIGVITLIRKYFPELPIHCSTQMTITGAEFAMELKKLGVTRVVTPRELSYSEINNIYKATSLEIESFVHGALCYCYSGQCLLSSVIGGRSGNRGRCAQPCRLPYSIEKEHINEKYLLSPKDMCTLTNLPKILQCGVYSLKIEGRMKKPEYVAAVTAIYRKYVDMYLENPSDYHVEEKDLNILKDIYNRGGFTTGFYDKQNGADMMAIDRPNHSGVNVCKVNMAKKGSITIKPEIELNDGDILEVLNTDIKDLTLKNSEKKGETVELYHKYALPNAIGQRVIRTRNNKLIKEILEKYLFNEKGEYIEPEIKLNIVCTIKKDIPIELVILDDNIEVKVCGDIPYVAQNKPLSKEDVIKQINKTGGTPFRFENIIVDIEDGLFVPVKHLNEIRRNALLEYTNKRILPYKDRRKLENIDIAYDTNNKTQNEIKLNCLITTYEQFECTVKEDSVNGIYIEMPAFDILHIEKMIEEAHNAHKLLYLALPYIFRDRAKRYYVEIFDKLDSWNVDGYLFRNLESYFYLKNSGLIKDKDIIFDSNVYSFNNADIDYYKKIGAHCITASYESNHNELKRLDTSFMEMNLYGYIPVMYSAGCVKKTINKCDCSSKTAPGITVLKDRLKNNISVLNYCRYCYNVIYNTLPLNLDGCIEEISNLGFASYRINFVTEDSCKCNEILSRITQSLEGRKFLSDKGQFTKGHFKRGVN